MPSEAYSLPYVPCCRHCKAKRFYHETNGFCCADGTISLATNAIPDQLYDLFTSNTDESAHFKTYVRTYNNKFAFTSFGVKFDEDLCRRNRGIYTFRTQGQIYHYINDLIHLNGRPSYLQLYFYDTEHELENRISDSDRMNPSIIAQLIDILHINPYSLFFRSLGDLSNLENQVIHIRSDVGLDQHIYVFSHSGGSHIVQYYFGCYDPLQYPLLFPLGDTGWHQGIQRVNRGSTLTKNVRSILLLSGRLLQQFVVDMYVKIETSRLDYFRSKQQHIQSELYQGIVDTITLGETDAFNVGKRIILPSSFIGGPRDMRKRYMEAMALVQRYGESNRPDLVARVFRAKLEELKDRLFKQQIFGKKLYAPESFDEIVSAEIPDKNINLHLYNARSDNGITVKLRGHNLDNRWVVPYNPYLLATFDCHINVEICSTIKVVKYLYKYVYKGHDRVAFNLVSEQTNQQIDEIQQFQSARWIAPPEAMWRIYGFIVNEMYPSVYSLHLHLEDKHQVTFRANEDLINVLNSDRSAKSMLTEFFALNQVDENARTLLYKEFPEFYVWSQQYKEWTPNPFEGERYYLRILLNHVRGPLSFEDLRTVDGVVAPTFREAATMHGLLQRDSSLQDCLHEASLYQMPSSLRRLFATILVYYNPTNPRELWERFKQDMSVDFRSTENSMSDVRMQVLRSISFTLESMGKDINSFHLLDDNICFGEDQLESREIDDELAVEIPEEDIVASEALNSKQRHVYNSVLEKVFSNEAATFFVDGPAGTGKTFLYKALLAAVRSRKLVALVIASSGVAASILPGGRTAHSRFKIPLDTDEHSICCVNKQSAIAKLLRVVMLIIWDEAPMSRKQHIQALDKMLRDINDSELTFGGKVVVFGGDFRQVLPVFHLTENMRARLDPVFSEYVLELGNGMPPITVDETIKILDGMLVPYEDDCTSLDHLIDVVFHDIHEYSINISAMMNRAILTPKNSYVDEINALLIHRFPGELKRYYSFDEAIDTSEQSIMEDFLNTLTPNGLPPHELLLKINCPIMLLRNINPSEGLCNGTRLICQAFDQNVIDAKIAVGHHSEKRVFIPRIPFLPNVDENSGFPFKRTQFPIILSFAMTINKSQGQTLDFVGIYLPQPVFSHGQLYVALSRAKTASTVRILIRPVSTERSEKNCTKHIVYTELLRLASSD
ncbi:hypothetical protein I3842_09G107500 [Carya illinoinensis]|uniref:ATP-dependent DNA helicase n=1 Tax=Carya illinoinensis TaxID=32201 RepID=A0A922E4Z0_CARIL|nr:hypothetical protein I3842_09G107500 [Carya illinoinensis]